MAKAAPLLRYKYTHSPQKLEKKGLIGEDKLLYHVSLIKSELSLEELFLHLHRLILLSQHP